MSSYGQRFVLLFILLLVPSIVADVTVLMNDPQLVYTGNRKSLNGQGTSVWGASQFYDKACGGVVEAGVDYNDDFVTLFFTGTKIQVNFIGDNMGPATSSGRIQINGTTVQTVPTYSASTLQQCAAFSAVIDNLPPATHQVTFIQDIGRGIIHSFSYTPYTPPAISKPQSYDDTESVHPGPIIAGVLGGLAVVAVVGATIFFIRRRRQERQEKAVDAEIATRRQSQAEGLDMKQAYAAIDWSPPSLAHTRPSRAPSMGSVKEEPEQQR